MPLPKAASQLHDKSTQRLFVVDEQRRPVGVLTGGDVVRALASHRSEASAAFANGNRDRFDHAELHVIPNGQ